MSEYHIVGEDDEPPRWAGPLVATLVSLQFSAFAITRSLTPRHACDADILSGAEMLKLSVSMTLCLMSRERPQHAVDWLYASGPVVAFLAMNLIGMWATRLVDSSVFVLLMQLKVVFTALAARVLRGRRLSVVRVYALALLCLGCVGGTTSESPHTESRMYGWAIAALVGETALSGLTGVITQTLLEAGVWTRNVQMSTLSLLALRGVAYMDERCTTDGVFDFSVGDALLATLGGLGGIGVALTLLYAGAIEKTVATSSSIVLTTTFHSIVSQSLPSIPQIAAITTVVLSVVLYAHDPTA